MKEYFKRAHDKSFDVFMVTRHIASYVEAAFILLSIYSVPPHTLSEASVSFFMCMGTKAIFHLAVRRFIDGKCCFTQD